MDDEDLPGVILTGRFLRSLVNQGAVDRKEVYRQTGGRGWATALFYDTGQLKRHCGKRSVIDVAREWARGQAHSRKAIREVSVQAEAVSGTGTANKNGRGRPADVTVHDKRRVCYEVYMGGKKMSLAMMEAAELLGDECPKTWSHLRREAGRYAEKEKKSMDRENAKNAL